MGAINAVVPFPRPADDVLHVTGYTAIVLNKGLSREAWERIGQDLGRAMKSGRWDIGDWLAFGERTYGETFARAVEITGRTYSDLSSMASVAARVPVSNRLETLSWSHHAVVADLDHDAQREWLHAAETNGWSKAELRRLIIVSTGTKTKLTECVICGDVRRRAGERCIRCDAIAHARKSDPRGMVVFVASDPVKAARELMNDGWHRGPVDDDFLRRYVAEIQKRLNRHAATQAAEVASETR